MSVLGLDIGNLNSTIALAHRGGVHIIANEASSRSTPSLVAYGSKQHFVGESASSQHSTNLFNTVDNLKLLLGRHWSDPSFQQLIPHIGFNKLVEMPGDAVGIEVMYKGESRQFLPEQVMASLFMKLKDITQRDTKLPVSDVVVSVPSYYDAFQRRALFDAASIANLNLLHTINDHAAAAINYGLYKIELSDEQPRRVLIINIGHLTFEASIVDFYRSKSKIIGSSLELGLGGNGVDNLLANHFADIFLASHKIDLRKYPKSWFRLLSSVVKVKKIINANTIAPLNVECIFEEYDINTTLTREQYQTILQPFMDRIGLLIDQLFEKYSLKPEDLFSCELIGSASRNQMIQKLISSKINKPLSFTMNAEEAVARGCALQCAILSPKFRVRDYGLTDIVQSTIEIAWAALDDSDDIEKCVDLFPAQSSFPSPKWVNFVRPQSKPFYITVRYKDTSRFAYPQICVINITEIPVQARGEAEIRVKIRLDCNGLIKVECVELLERAEQTSPTIMDVDSKLNQDESNPDASATAPSVEQPPKESATSPPVNASGAASSPLPSPDNGEKKKSQVRRVPIPFTVTWTHGLDQDTINSSRVVENAIIEDTTTVLNIIEAKNSLESYVYDARDKLNDIWRKFVAQEEYASFEGKLEETQNWLYEYIENETKDIYESRLLHLHTLGDPIENRLYEHENRPFAIAKYRAAADGYSQQATQPLEEYAHIGADEKLKVIQNIAQCDGWLSNMIERQNALSPFDNPILLSSDITAKTNSLHSLAKSVFSKPVPVPAVKAPSAAGAADGSDPQSSEAQQPTDATNPESMDTDENEPVNQQVPNDSVQTDGQLPLEAIDGSSMADI